MPPPNVDIVFVLDASESMKPCFDGLKKHLNVILAPMQGYVNKVRFGLLAHFAAPLRGRAVYEHTFLGGQGPEMLPKLYGQGSANDANFFTTDGNLFARKLGEIKLGANEEMLIALDTALDFPFGPLHNTKRVVVLFSDEKLEDGLEQGKYNDKIPDIIDKLHKRKIKLFVAMPGSDGLWALAAADQSEVEEVADGNGLSGVDFAKLLGQMGKSISGSSLQATSEPRYQRAIFGQDKWGSEGRIVDASVRNVVLAVGESATLDTSQPITDMNVKLNWTAEVDLDLHAFVRLNNGASEQVFFANKNVDAIRLDRDSGVGDVGGNNEENINVSSLGNLREVLFATKIFCKGGCFADYDGKIVVSTNNGDSITVPLSAQQRADWCVIAKLDNTDSSAPRIINLNRVMNDEPSL